MAALAAACVGLAFCARHAALNAGFLFDDEGHNLLVADTLLSGGRLYRDVFSQYGPLPAYAHALFAAAFGNTPLTYLSYVAIVSSANVVFAYLLARRVARPAVAAFAALGVAALSIAPGSLVGGYTSAAYLPLERTLLLLVALCWTDPLRRGFRDAFILGCLLGVWQGVKFGGAFFAGASIVVIDAAALSAAGWSRERGRIWFAALAATAVAFAVLQGMWIVWAFATLRPSLAVDVVWPSYMLRQYDAWVSPELRWIPWSGWPVMFAQYLLPAVAGAVSLVAFFHWVRGASAASTSDAGERTEAAAIFIPLCFFALGFFFYFRMVHHFRQFMWTLVPAVAWELERRRAVGRIVTAALWSPGLLMTLKVALAPSVAAASVAIALPSGGTIYTVPETAERIAFLHHFATVEAHGAPVLIAGCRSGFVYAYGIPHQLRRTCWDNSVSQPDDEAEARAMLERTVALVDCAAAPIARSRDLRFTASFSREVFGRLTPWTYRAGCYVYHIERPGLESANAAPDVTGSLAARPDRGRAVAADASRPFAFAGP